MPKSYSVKTKFSKKQINALLKDKNFKHDSHNDSNGDIELELDDLPLKEFNKMMRMKNGKPFVVKKGSGLFDSIKRGFSKVGDTLKDTFSEKNAKTATKIIVPGAVGGVTSLGVGTAASILGANPIVGALAGGAAGAVASKGTSVALNKALGDGIHTGAGFEEMFTTFISDPRVQSAMLAAGSYAAKKGIDLIIDRVGRSKVNKAKRLLDDSQIPYQDNEYYKRADNLYSKGVKEQAKYKTLQDDFQSGKMQNDMVNKVVVPPTVIPVTKKLEYNFGDGVVGYNKTGKGMKKGKGIGMYGSGIGGYQRGGSIMMDEYAKSIGAVQRLKSDNQLSKINMSHVVNGGPIIKPVKEGGAIIDMQQKYAESIGAIQDLNKKQTQFDKMKNVRSFRKMKA